MELNNLPTEVLENIFKHLPGKDLFACREVCVRWKHILKSLPEVVWRYACRQELGEGYREAYRRARLSWAELCASLTLWPAVNTAEVKTHKLTTSPAPLLFEVLQNGTIAIPQEKQLRLSFSCNSVVYYDLNTFKECDRVDFDRDFNMYKENENFIVFVDFNQRLCVKPKQSKELLIADRLALEENTYDTKILDLHENEVYFKNINRIGLFKFEGNADTLRQQVTIITLEDYLSRSNILSICYVDINTINILVIDDNNSSRNNLNIYTYSSIAPLGQRFTKLEAFERLCQTYPYKICSELSRYGFNWRSPFLYKWIIEFNRQYYGFYYNMFSNNSTGTKKRKIIEDLSDWASKIVAICVHGDIYLAGTDDLKLRVYYKPFFGALGLNYLKPIRTFDLVALLDLEANTNMVIRKLDVVETLNGHKVIMCIGTQVFILELVHRPSDDDDDADDDGDDDVLKRPASTSGDCTNSNTKKIKLE